MKQKLVYISSEWFFDTDKDILKYLSEVYDVYWLYITDGKFSRVDKSVICDYAKENKLSLHLLLNKRKQLSPANLFFYYKVRNYISRIKPNCIIKVEQDIFWSLVNRTLKQQTIYMVHDAQVHSGTHNGWIRQIFTNWTIKMNNNFIVFSNSQYQLLHSKYPHKNILTTHMSIKDFGESKKMRPSISNEIRLLFFGRIESNKGLDKLISSLEEKYSGGDEKIKLTICGKGSFWSTCEKLIKNKQNYNLQIRFIKNEEIPDIFASHHFLVLPYRDATQSGPLMIAANYNLPILATNLNSFKEVYTDKMAIYNDNIKQGLDRLEHIDSDTYKIMLAECGKLKSLFSARTIANEIISFLKYCN